MRIYAAFALALAFLAGCSVQEEQPALSAIHGIITDEKGAPLENASITLVGANIYSNETGGDGAYSIAGIEPDEYRIVAAKEGRVSVIVPVFVVAEGNSYGWNASLRKIFTNHTSNATPAQTGGRLHGTVGDLLNRTLANVSVRLVGDTNYTSFTDKGGRYGFENVSPGEYEFSLAFDGYKNRSARLTVAAGHSYEWNFTLSRDCVYYAVNGSVNYSLEYGYEGTLYRGYDSFALAYPEGASYEVYPQSGISTVSIIYDKGERMLAWKLNNSAGDYPSVRAHLFIRTDGEGAIALFNDTGMGTGEAGRAQPAFLGDQIWDSKTGRVMIEPSDAGISALAARISDGSEASAWETARQIFIWLKNNTQYYQGPQSSVYTQSAKEVMRSQRGDCDELSYLYISLCRAAGIPARLVRGYLVENNPPQYQSHMWVEFYDGEWVPVEVAGTASSQDEAEARFGVDRPDHVALFVDDGASASLNFDREIGAYYDKPPEFSQHSLYSIEGSDPKYIAVCADGRHLADRME